MPEGRFGFDRKFAQEITVLDLEFTKDVPIGRDETLTNDFLRRLKNEKLITNRDTNINTGTRELNPENVRITGPDTLIDNVGTLKIDVTNPSTIEIEDLETFFDNINSIIFNVLKANDLRTDKIVGTDGDIRAKINGPAGGPRPFVPSELVFEALYIKEMPRQAELEIEDDFLNILDKRVDARVDNNILLVNIRDDSIDKNKLRDIRGIFRDTGREYGTDLEVLSIMPDGSKF